jgi:hypothetical protein
MMHRPPEPKRLSDSSAPIEFFPPGRPPSEEKQAYPDALTCQVSEAILSTLPNDLTRMIYLASLRDCNSGLYLHPELSHQHGVSSVDRALRLFHERVFRRLLTTPLPEYVLQLQEYIRYTRGETHTVLNTWKCLQAYRATVPLAALSLSAELFFLNIEIALEMLGAPGQERQDS